MSGNREVPRPRREAETNMMRDGLRAFVDGVQRDIGKLQRSSPQQSPGVAGVVESWGRLVDFLALGPAPELRECPHCGAAGMREATRCGYCWGKLVPQDGHVARAERTSAES
jgi:hypothetical protein